MINLDVIRKTFIYLLCVGTVFATISCSKTTQTSSNEDTLERIRRTGQIDACTAIDPPYTIKDAKTGAYSGIYVDAMNLIAQKMNAKIVWHETTFGNATGDLAAGRCDVMVSDFFANIPRSMTVAFTLPAMEYMGLGVLVRKEDPRFMKIHDAFELDRPDLTIVTASGEAGNLFIKDNFKKAKEKQIDVESSDLNRFCVEVSTNRADAAIAGSELIDRYARQHPEVRNLFAGHPFSLNPIGWAVRQDDVKWLHFLETALQFLDTQGTIAQLEKKYNAHALHLVKQYKLQ